jgi:hypothetical protein
MVLHHGRKCPSMERSSPSLVKQPERTLIGIPLTALSRVSLEGLPGVRSDLWEGLFLHLIVAMKPNLFVETFYKL